MGDVHKVFVSFHHQDQKWKDDFEKLCKDKIVSWSVELGDIDSNINTETIRRKIRDEYLRESTVTVVLIGSNTWQRKHVDWEIYSSLKQTEYNPRSGLLGIILPMRLDYGKDKKVDIHTIPPRLADNTQKNSKGEQYANIYDWIEDSSSIQTYIDRAFKVRTLLNPDLHRPLFRNNHTGSFWQD